MPIQLGIGGHSAIGFLAFFLPEAQQRVRGKIGGRIKWLVAARRPAGGIGTDGEENEWAKEGGKGERGK
jgi:hypothetical protein